MKCVFSLLYCVYCVLGAYVYIETSSPRIVGDYADLVSPIMSPALNGPACFSLWYHMYGPSIGNLSVLTVIDGVTATRSGLSSVWGVGWVGVGGSSVYWGWGGGWRCRIAKLVKH
jgi:hypothetical protein